MGHALARRPVLIVAASAVVAVGLGACGSSSHAAVTTPARTASSASVTPASPSSSTPSEPAADAPITLPAQSPAPVAVRTVSRPAGLPTVDGALCIGAVLGDGAAGDLRLAMTDYTQHAEQVNQVGAAAGQLMAVLPDTRSLLAALRKAGYPAAFPVVRDVTELIAVETGVIDAWHSQVLTAVPSLYLRLATASKQYVADTTAAYHSTRDICS